ncbi:PREDICTED: V-type proton ATPase subunit S1-like [Amphimedon queenslandica]|uniref:V-type proton ATPase subunit S1/VOA1 transmembrane domain-containing protein n=2 Tax=Amphimedon queenslandica TaxID=400682 RepID=A0AAN0ICY1_AMPQE|nr:PREDICTED: V-type proton ATPase subunit S1-like [Amphimedon queenslandica]|eukprot:XP_003385672.1 PREDICTED: V-type proton ATPase subunit S1-like [Amphimedon queenslandica]
MIKMAIKGLVLGLLFCLLSVSSGEQLTPFVAWSNKDILNGVTLESTDLDQILSVILPRAKDVDSIVIFATEELTFDDFNKQFGVYDELSSELKGAVLKSSSYYWTGVSDTGSGDWVSRLASSRGTTVHRIRGSARKGLDLNGVIVVELDSVDNQDAVIGELMSQTDDKSFLAVYTSSLLKERRDKRDIPLMEFERELEPRAVTPSTENTDTCGSLKCNGTEESLLFCLIDAYVYYDIDGNGRVNCSLDASQANFTYCCSGDISPECNDTTPYVALSYPYNNDTCRGDDYINEGTISIKFSFDVDSNEFWSISMTANVTNESSVCVFDDMQMSRQESKLYYPFKMSQKSSYACSATYYNNYTQNITSANATSDCSPGSMIFVIFKNLQVQPFSVSGNTFSTAYNCEGYFTPTAWMGVVAVAILILILYLSIVSVFSLQTINQFEDPRGESINVERLH